MGLEHPSGCHPVLGQEQVRNELRSALGCRVRGVSVMEMLWQGGEGLYGGTSPVQRGRGLSLWSFFNTPLAAVLESTLGRGGVCPHPCSAPEVGLGP